MDNKPIDPNAVPEDAPVVVPSADSEESAKVVAPDPGQTQTESRQVKPKKHYVKGERLGSGSFGEVFAATKRDTDEQVAMKLEPRKKGASSLLKQEAQLYRLLEGGVGFPKAYSLGHTKDHFVLVMDLLGPSLENLFEFCSNEFSVKTVLMLADQILTRIEFLHKKGWLHRDLKPDNLVMGLGRDCNKVYLIDYGLSKEYIDKETKRHVEFRKSKRFTGTMRYCSVNAQNGVEPSRRDDLEALGHIMVYFIRGVLPWQGIKAKTKEERIQKILSIKVSSSIRKLCEACPEEIEHYLTYCRALAFEEEPDYLFLRGLLRKVFKSQGYQYDYYFDWAKKVSRDEF